MRPFTSGKRHTYAVLGTALLALAFGVSVGVAKSGPGQVKAAIIYDSFNKACPGGFGASHKKIGTLTAIREKGLATFRANLHGAVRGDYVVNLYDGACNLLLQLGSFKVDRSGDGNFATQLALTFGQSFFLDFYNQDSDIHNSTMSFKLGSSGVPPGASGADLAVTKSVDNPTPNVGETVTFTLTVTNAGPITATGVTLSDLLPPGLSFVSATPSQGTYDSSTGVWNVGTVATGSPQTLAIQAAVLSPDPGTNTATIAHADQLDANPGNNSASVGLQVPIADLALTQIPIPTEANINDIVAFNVLLTNHGPNTATGVTVSDVLPPEFSFIQAFESTGTSYDQATGVWTVGTVTSGQTKTLALIVTLVSPTGGTNTATIIHSDQFDPDLSNNSSSATIHVPVDLAVAKIVDNPTPNVGQTVTFTVTLTNPGPNVATGVTVHDVLPPGLSFVSATPSQGVYNSGSGDWTVGTLGPGAATLAIQATVTSADPLENQATIAHSDQVDPNPANNAASAVVQAQKADLALTKTVFPSSVMVGQLMNFTVSLSDLGPNVAMSVIVHDLLPPGFSFQSATASVGFYSPVSGDWNIVVVPPGPPVTLTIVGMAISPGPWVNVATIAHADQFDPDLSNNTDFVFAVVTP